MSNIRIKSYKWNGYLRWKAYRKDWNNPSANLGNVKEWGLYADGFDSLEHLMDWLFANAPGLLVAYRKWQRTKPEFR